MYPNFRDAADFAETRETRAVMDFFDGHHYRLNKRLLFYIGLWPLQTRNERNLYRTTTIILYGSLLVPKLIKFTESLGDVNGMIECLPMLGVHFRSVTKFINGSVNVTKMRRLADRIREDWSVRTGKIDGPIIQNYAERGRLLTVIYTVYMYTALTMYLSIPLIPIVLDILAPLNQTRERVYLLQTEYFVDQDDNYFYLMIHAYFTMPIALGVIIAYDTMYMVYVQHTCSIFATLGARLQSIGRSANGDQVKIPKDAEKPPDEAYDDILTCIKLHNEALEVATLLESTSCVTYLIVLGASMLTITVTGFMTVVNLDQPGEAMRFVLIVLGELIHLFYICWQGQLLMEHSEDVFINAYNVEWCEISPRARKLLVLIMLRSLQSSKLTAGKLFILSMESYAATLKTSMSYFTVLLTMQ